MSDAVIEGNAHELPPEQAPGAPKPPSAVLVLKKVSEDGEISVDVQTLGDVLATEVLTLLEMAPGQYRQKIGLPAR